MKYYNFSERFRSIFKWFTQPTTQYVRFVDIRFWNLSCHGDTFDRFLKAAPTKTTPHVRWPRQGIKAFVFEASVDQYSGSVPAVQTTSTFVCNDAEKGFHIAQFIASSTLWDRLMLCHRVNYDRCLYRTVKNIYAKSKTTHTHTSERSSNSQISTNLICNNELRFVWQLISWRSNKQHH